MIRALKRNYTYAWSLLPGLLVITGNLAGGWWGGLNFMFSLGFLAIAERFVPDDRGNDPGQEGWFPDGLLVAHVFSQIACIATLLAALADGPVATVPFLLMVASTGVHSGSGAIVIAHELVHRKHPVMNRLGQFLLFTAGNIYFYIDHLKVHHKWVGTGKDPATARYRENVYGFFVRSVVQQIISSLRVEARRLKAAGRLPYTPANYVIGAGMLQLIFWLLLAYLFGWMGAIAFIGQSLVANFLLEYTNYIEHYGLTRAENERVTEAHSWQTDKFISRYFLIDLSRHADHHYHASKPYHQLLSYANSPVLPGGYVSMIYYALIPPLFFRKMHPVLEKLSTAHQP